MLIQVIIFMYEPPQTIERSVHCEESVTVGGLTDALI